MYGVPKYRTPFWFKYKKEAYVVIASVIAITTVIRFSPNNQKNTELAKDVPSNHSITKFVDQAYSIEFNGKEIGVVENQKLAKDAVDKAYSFLKKRLGYDPEIDTKINLKKVEHAKIVEQNSDITAKLEVAFNSMVEKTKKKAYVVKVGNEFTVALPDEESAKEVLQKAQKKFLTTNMDVNVDLAQSDHNNLVRTPKLLVFNPNESERQLVTSSDPTVEKSKSPLGAINNIVNKVKEKIKTEDNEPLSANPENTKVTADTQFVAPKSESNEKLLEVSLPKDVLIAESYVDPKRIVDVDKATELITQNRVEQKVYYVQSGDSPGVIAEKNNMGLSKLYQLNPSLQNGNATIHVGDQLVVTAPEPLLKVIAKYETSYQEPILKTLIEEKDDSMYVGTSKVKTEGRDGVQNVTAILTKVNGQQVASQVTNTQVITEMKPMVRLIGSKPLPPKATTGKFIYPLKRFILSSGYGYRWGSFHGGIDLAAPRGTTIMAADGGTVIEAGWHHGYGYMVKIRHTNGTATLYGHMSKITCSIGQKVAQGQKIGEVGSTGNSTGNHCHFEIYINGVRVNPSKYL